MKKVLVLIVVLCAIANAQFLDYTIGDRCPNSQVVRTFSDGSYLLKEDENNRQLVCRTPNKIDSFLVVAGVFNRGLLYNRVSEIRFRKFNHASWTKEEVKDPFFGLEMGTPRMRSDGLYEITGRSSSGDRYYTISAKKDAYPYISYAPIFKFEVCGTNTVLFEDYYDISNLIHISTCYEVDYFLLSSILHQRESQLRAGKELTFCASFEDSNCVVDKQTYIASTTFGTIVLSKGKEIDIHHSLGGNFAYINIVGIEKKRK